MLINAQTEGRFRRLSETARKDLNASWLKKEIPSMIDL